MPRTMKKPAAKKPAAKKPAAKKPAVKKPAPKKPATKKPAAKKPAAKKPAAKKPPTGESWDKLPASESEAAFNKFIEEARDYTGTIIPYRGLAILILDNVRQGVASLRAIEADVAAQLPRLDRAALWSLPELALALGFAARAAENAAPDSLLPRTLMPRVYELRELLLKNAEGLASAGLIKQAEVEKIRAGRGQIDAAQDCVDLAALYRRHAAALRGKTPVTADKVREASEAGTAALKALRPAGSRHTATPNDAARDRDRLYTLLLTHHRVLRRAGMYFWGEAVDNHVPPLLSREVRSRPKTAKDPKTPPAA